MNKNADAVVTHVPDKGPQHNQALLFNYYY